MTKYCSITVDLDSFEVLNKFYGITEVSTYESFYKIVVPRFIEVFNKFDVKATFFVVGSDLKDKINMKFLEKLMSEGHEIANHTYSHPFGMHKLTWQEKESEIKKNEKIIEDSTGIRPVGFRAPGYDIDKETMDILRDRGYLYDSSVFPTFLAFVFEITHKVLRKKNAVETSMGGIFMSFAPNRPYFPDKNSIWKNGNSTNLLEIPVSTTPLIRLPFYANFHLLLGNKFFDVNLKFMRGVDINYLFHGIELVDCEKDNIHGGLLQHPNVSKPLEAKIEFYQKALKSFSDYYRVMPARELAEKLIQRKH